MTQDTTNTTNTTNQHCQSAACMDGELDAAFRWIRSIPGADPGGEAVPRAFLFQVLGYRDPGPIDDGIGHASIGFFHHFF